MVSFLLFLTVVAFSAAVLAFMAGAEFLLNPFKTRGHWVNGFIFTLLTGPSLLTLAFTVNSRRVDYCPPLEPIAAPDLAEFGIPVEIVDFPENARLKNALNVANIALETARAKIVELEVRIKTLEAVRIKAPTPTPITQPQRPVCRGPRCTSG